MFLRFVSFYLILLISGCAVFSDKDNAAQPTKLEAIDATVSLKRLWHHDTGKGTDKQLLKLVPAMSDGSIYVADRSGSVEALQRENGKRRWKTETNTALSAGPGQGEGLLLVGTSDGELIALDEGDGSILWRIPVSSEVLAIPRVYSGVALVQTADGNVTGYDSQSGEQRWVFDRTEPVLTLRGTSSPVIIDGIALVGFASGKLAALDVESGRPLWESSISLPRGRSEIERLVDVDSDPVVAQGILYAGSFQGSLAAIDMRGGSILWKRDLSAHSGMSVDSGQLYTTDDSSQVWALDISNGRSMWKQDKLKHRHLTGPVTFGDFIAVGDLEGYVHLLSKEDGHFLGRIKVGKAGIQSVPVRINETLLVLGSGGNLGLFSYSIAEKK